MSQPIIDPRQFPGGALTGDQLKEHQEREAAKKAARQAEIDAEKARLLCYAIAIQRFKETLPDEFATFCEFLAETEKGKTRPPCDYVRNVTSDGQAGIRMDEALLAMDAGAQLAVQQITEFVARSEQLVKEAAVKKAGQ